MQLTSQILAFGRIYYAIKQYMQLSNVQLTVQFSYSMAGIGLCFFKFYAINQYMQLSNMQLSDTVCTSTAVGIECQTFSNTLSTCHNVPPKHYII